MENGSEAGDVTDFEGAVVRAVNSTTELALLADDGASLRVLYYFWALQGTLGLPGWR